ncbi:asparagine synthase-related protein [Sphingomonas oryzagri]
MRPRYLLLSGPIDSDRRDRIERRVADNLPERRAQKDSLLLTMRDCPVIDMPAVDGWIVGSLFTANGRERQLSLDPANQLAIMSAPDDALIHRASGSYVAIWRDVGPAPLTVLRDPSGSLPAWYVIDGPVVAVASDVDVLLDVGLIALTPDPVGLRQHLRYPFVPSVRTCLIRVQELLPGRCIRFGASVGTRLLWRPSTFAACHHLDVSSIATAIDNVVAGLRAGRTRIAIEFSGGLDSSIVAAALYRSGDCGVGLHMVPAAGDADERHFARLVADRFPMAVHEIPIGAGHFDLLARPSRLTARPPGFSHMQGINHAMRQAQLDAEVEAVFSGAGGDSVFCSIHSTGPILDAWADGGLKLARDTAIAIAEIVGTTRGDVLRHAMARLLRGRRARPRWPADERLLARGEGDEPEPDTAMLEGLRPGARAHVAGLLRIQSIIDVHDRMGEGGMLFPLLAQPVLEACLAIPSWRWMRGGRDRAAARDAYAGRVPDAILRRRGKARLDTLLVAAYDTSRSGLRALLVDGWLARHGIIDSAAVDRAVAMPVGPTSTLHARLFALADAESWCRMILDRQSEAGTR